jgi:lipid-A-disaccharide synthase
MVAPWGKERGLEFRPVTGRTEEAMRACDYALVASGTATLECAVLGTPLAVVYDMSLMTQWLARILTGGREHYSLPNIVAGRTIVPEFYGVRARPRDIADAAKAGLEPGVQARMAADYAEMRDRLGKPGALRNAAEQVLGLLGRPS